MTERKKVLVVDDDVDMRRLLLTKLDGFDVSYAQDGVSAISEARKEAPDLIILDIGLPAGDGFIALQRLKESPKLGTIPVLVFSERENAEVAERALAAGARGFYRKSGGAESLIAAVWNTLRARHPH